MPRKKKEPEKEKTVVDQRSQMIRQSNELIMKSKKDLTLVQQKVVLYLISQVTPFDRDFQYYDFDIADFCKVCGIANDGRRYTELKNNILKIAKVKWWAELPDGRETVMSWIEKPYMNKGSGLISIRLDNDLRPFLLNLKNNYTEYEIIWTLRFKSKYSLPLYDLCKSIHYHELESYTRRFTLEELRKILGAENYVKFKDFRVRVLDVAVREINAYSDKQVTYTPYKRGGVYAGVSLTVSSLGTLERLQRQEQANRDLGIDPDQLTFFDELREAGWMK